MLPHESQSTITICPPTTHEPRQQLPTLHNVPTPCLGPLLAINGWFLFQHSGPAGPAPNPQHTGGVTGLSGPAFKSHSIQPNKPGASAYGPQPRPFCGQRNAPNSWPAFSSCGLASSSCNQQQPELPFQQGLCSPAGILGHNHQPAAAPLARAGGWAQL